MTIRTTTRDANAIARAIKNGEDFTTGGALKGVANPSWVHTGRMNAADSAVLYATHDIVEIDYVVYSYGTPIAYRTAAGEWTIPSAKYSVTTSKHQGTTRYAISLARP